MQRVVVRRVGRLAERRCASYSRSMSWRANCAISPSRALGARHDHHAAGVLVEPVHDAGPARVVAALDLGCDAGAR